MLKLRLVVTAGVMVCVGAASGAELLVSSFWTSRIGQYALPTGPYLGDLPNASNFVNPLCARLGPDGLLYVASEATDSIARYDAITLQFVDNFVSPGSGGLDSPTGVTWGPDGNLYVPSFTGDSILR